MIDCWLTISCHDECSQHAGNYLYHKSDQVFDYYYISKNALLGKYLVYSYWISRVQWVARRTAFSLRVYIITLIIESFKLVLGSNFVCASAKTLS